MLLLLAGLPASANATTLDHLRENIAATLAQAGIRESAVDWLNCNLILKGYGDPKIQQWESLC